MPWSGEQDYLKPDVQHQVVQVLVEAGGVCTAIGQNLVQYEVSFEQLVLQELETIL